MRSESQSHSPSHTSTLATTTNKSRKEWYACAVVLALTIGLTGAAAAQARTLTILRYFADGSGGDGAHPLYAGVIRDSAGNIYGTTNQGGNGDCKNTDPLGCGTLFKLDTNRLETSLHFFGGGPDGAYPGATLWRDAAGNLYGTTQAGGASNAGTIFKFNHRTTEESVLYSFTGGADGGQPLGGLIRDAAGNFYGTTLHGGVDPLQVCNSGAGCGVVFKLDLAGNQTVLYSFKGETDGGEPFAGLVRDAAGNLYGTTQIGGDPSCVTGVGCGTVFKVDKSGNETVLYSFKGGADGLQPVAGLVRDEAGNLYGTTLSGGDPGCGGGFGCGVVFKIDGAGNETVLYTFTGGADGNSPYAGLIRDDAGYLWGTTVLGGTHGSGTVYRVDPSGNEIVLHSFAGGSDGAGPYAGVIRDLAGNFYGTTNSGGDLTCAGGCGTVYKIAAVAP